MISSDASEEVGLLLDRFKIDEKDIRYMDLHVLTDPPINSHLTDSLPEATSCLLRRWGEYVCTVPISWKEGCKLSRIQDTIRCNSRCRETKAVYTDSLLRIRDQDMS